MWRLSEILRDSVIDFCLWLIRKTERYKSRTLAQRLYDLARDYDPT